MPAHSTPVDTYTPVLDQYQNINLLICNRKTKTIDKNSLQVLFSSPKSISLTSKEHFQQGKNKYLLIKPGGIVIVETVIR